MNEKLIEYISKRLELGHNAEDIKKALLSGGHDFINVEQHLNHVMGLKNAEEKMKKFIKKHVEKGVHKDKIRGYLVNAGYKEDTVDKNIKRALKSKRNKRIMKLSIGIAIVLASVFFLYMLLGVKFDNLIKEKPLNSDSQTNVQEIIYENSVKEECDQACKDKPILEKALLARDIKICGEIKDAATRAWCEQFLKR